MSEHTPTPWPKPVFENDVGPDDEGYWEWWAIYGVGKFDQESDALLAYRAVNSRAALVGALRLALSALDNSLRSAGSSTAGFIASRKLMAKAQSEARAALKLAEDGK